MSYADVLNGNSVIDAFGLRRLLAAPPAEMSAQDDFTVNPTEPIVGDFGKAQLAWNGFSSTRSPTVCLSAAGRVVETADTRFNRGRR
jgi:hypothetical protein